MMTGYGPTIWFAKLPKDGTGTGTYYAGQYRVDYQPVTNMIFDNPGYSLNSPTGVSVSVISPTTASTSILTASSVAAGTGVDKIQRRKMRKK